MKRQERIEILLEDINSKLALLLEGHESLRKENLSRKIDAVAADLIAHRADTEVHRTPYRVGEPS